MILYTCVAYDPKQTPIALGVKVKLWKFEFVALGVFVPLGQV